MVHLHCSGIKIPNKEINQCICNTHLNIINIVTCRSVLTSLCLKFLSDSCRVQGLAACLLHNSTQFPKTFPPTTLKLTKLLSKSSKFKRSQTFEIFIKMIGKNWNVPPTGLCFSVFLNSPAFEQCRARLKLYQNYSEASSCVEAWQRK